MSTDNDTVERTPRNSARPLRWTKKVLSSRAALAVLLLLLAIFLLKGYLSPEPPYGNICDQYRHVLLKTRELADESASESQWAAFDQEMQRRIAPYVAELHELTQQSPPGGDRSEDTINHFVRGPLFRIGKYELPRFIRDARNGDTLEDEFARIEAELAGVQRALDVIAMGEAPKIEQRR